MKKKGVDYMFKRTFMLTESDKRKVSEMSGKIMLWILEGRSIGYMSEKLNLPPWQIEHNIDAILYTYMRKVGRWRYFKILFRK